MSGLIPGSSSKHGRVSLGKMLTPKFLLMAVSCVFECFVASDACTLKATLLQNISRQFHKTSSHRCGSDRRKSRHSSRISVRATIQYIAPKRCIRLVHVMYRAAYIKCILLHINHKKHVNETSSFIPSSTRVSREWIQKGKHILQTHWERAARSPVFICFCCSITLSRSSCLLSCWLWVCDCSHLHPLNTCCYTSTDVVLSISVIASFTLTFAPYYCTVIAWSLSSVLPLFWPPPGPPNLSTPSFLWLALNRESGSAQDLWDSLSSSPSPHCLLLVGKK